MRLLVAIAVLASTIVSAAPAGAGTPPAVGVDLALDLSDSGVVPVLVLGGPGVAYEYRVEVANHGSVDASAPATVIDVLPAPFALDDPAYTAGEGVTCAAAPPLLECTVPAAQLRTGDTVVIRVRATIPAETLGGTYLNAAVVTSADDPAPCGVAAGLLVCAAPTDNADQEPTDLFLIGSEGASPSEPTLAFTGAATVPALVVGVLCVGVGGVLVVAGRRRRPGGAAR